MNRKNSIYGRDFIRQVPYPGVPYLHPDRYIKPGVYVTSTAKVNYPISERRRMFSTDAYTVVQ